MFIGTSSHGEKIFHDSQCDYVQRIKEKNQVYFYSAEEAREKGWRMCNCCSYMGKHFHKEQNEIGELQRKHGLDVQLYDGAVYIETSIAPWKIIVTGKNHRMLLYHGNHEHYNECERRNGKLIYHYHFQGDISKNTIIEYMEYLVEHDRWRAKTPYDYKLLPRHTKKQRAYYDKQKQKAKKKAICRVYNLIEKMQCGCI